MTEYILRPDAHTESATVDGRVQHTETDSTWAQLTGAVGTLADDDDGLMYGTVIASDPDTDLWFNLHRCIVLFDATSVTDPIASAIISLYCLAKLDDLNISPDLNIYSSAPATDTALVAGDFNSLGSTPFATAVAYSAITEASWVDFVLNSSGIANISGISKFGVKNANYDNAGSAPNWNAYLESYIKFATADTAGDYAPKLTIQTGSESWVRII